MGKVATPKFDKFVAKLEKKGFKLKIEPDPMGFIAIVTEGSYKGYCAARVDWICGFESFQPNTAFNRRNP